MGRFHTVGWMISLLAAAGLSMNLGCFGAPGGETASSDAFAQLLPDSERLRIHLRDHHGVPIAAAEDAAPMSEYYLFTHDVTDDVNDFIAEVLDIVRDITSYEGELIEDNTYAWGPLDYDALSPVVTYFVMTANIDGSYNWWFIEFPRGGDASTYVTEVAGGIDAGATEQESTGWFWVDYTLRQQMDPTRECAGEVYVDYELEPGVGAADVTFRDFSCHPADPPVDAGYVYRSEIGGDGTLLFGALADLNANGTEEVLVIRSEWLADGSGRSDASVNGIDTHGVPIHISECWSPAPEFSVVYHEDDAGLDPVTGDPAQCSILDDEPEYPEVGEIGQ